VALVILRTSASTSPEVAPLLTPPQIWIWRWRLRRSIVRSDSEGLNSAIWRRGTMRGVASALNE